MEFIDLKAQQKRIRQELESAISKVLSHGRYILGPEVQELEGALSRFVGTRFSITCSSGTDALLLALMAYGVGKGDAILTSPFTFIATAEVIALLGATPIFVDIREDDLNMDPDLLPFALEEAKKRGLVPRGIIPVDIFGLPCDYEKINNFAERNGLFVIEDAAQSFGAARQGKRACSLSHVGCTSFFPAKPLGCYGDGGAVFTDNESLAATIKSLRVHGQGRDKYENVRVGINGRLDTIQAAVLLCKLSIFEEELRLRQEVSERYNALFRVRCPQVRLQEVPEGSFSAWAQYTIRFPSGHMRDTAQAALNKEGIPTAIYYPIPLHLQTAFAYLGYGEGDFPVSEAASKRVLSLPMHPYLKEEDQVKIVRIIVDLIKHTL